MSFIEHLGELRTRLIRIAISLVASFILGFILKDYLLAFLRWPLMSGMRRYIDKLNLEAPIGPDGHPIFPHGAPQMPTWVTLAPTTSFIVYMKLAMYFAMVVSCPIFLYQVCAFVFPGLKKSERGLIVMLLGGSFVLAVFGVGTAYAGVLPFVMPYLLQYTAPDVVGQLELSETISFIMTILVGFAIAFQFPMLVMVGVALDIIHSSMLTQYRRIAIVAIAIISAVLTPPDVVSMSAMMLPLIFLYEISIIVAKIVEWRRKKNSQSTDITPV